MARDSDRTRRRVLAVFALGCSLLLAIGAVYAVFRVLGAYQLQLTLTEDAFRERIIEVPVTTRTLGVGSVITEADLKMTELGADYVPLTAITQMSELVGRTVIERVLVGDLVRLERLAPPESGQGLSALIPSGMRALGLDLASDAQVSGFIEPGDGVDVVVTLSEKDAKVTETVTLVQGARVLAVDEKISETVRGEKIRKPRVTVAVSPDIVEKVTHALEVGNTKLTLRSCIDMTHVDTNGIAGTSSLLGTDKERLTVQQFRERYTEADVVRMIEIVSGEHKVRERVVDPHLIRALPAAPPQEIRR